MKVDIGNKWQFLCRGGPVEVGNVYTNPKNRYFRIALNVIKRKDGRPWNNVVCIHVDSNGEIVGSSNQPEIYMSEHQDLVGKIKEMPSMKIEWINENHPH
jgi:hypothetical protein